jgi:hypothetical protein
MDPNAVSATLASQELLRPSPKSHSPCDVFSADEGGIAHPRGFSQPPCSQFTGGINGRGEKGHAHKWQLPPHQGLGMDSDGVVSGGQGGERGFGFWPEFIYPVVTSPPLLSVPSP